MELLHAKTLELRQTGELTPERKKNSDLNRQEALEQKAVLKSMPRRLVFELTNRCNLNCLMCGRNSADFQPTEFRMEWLKKFEPVIDRVEEVTLMGWGEPTMHPKFSEFLHWAYVNGLRKYFCTNGMRLDVLFNDIFKFHSDIIAVSLDGATPETNAKIRRGSDFKRVTEAITKINKYKDDNDLDYPYTNFVFAAMKQNIDEVPEMVQLASRCGMNEIKIVYLTSFGSKTEAQTLYDDMDHVKSIFDEAIHEAKRLDINLKLPHLCGEDPAEEKYHKDCYVGWRDFFLGSDGYVRPCMSTSQQMFSIDQYSNFEDMWNSNEFQRHRLSVNNAKMSISCKNCYQSSFANWNRKESFLQIGKEFSPSWSKSKRFL